MAPLSGVPSSIDVDGHVNGWYSEDLGFVCQTEDLLSLWSEEDAAREWDEAMAEWDAMPQWWEDTEGISGQLKRQREDEEEEDETAQGAKRQMQSDWEDWQSDNGQW